MFLEDGLSIEDAIHASFLFRDSQNRDLVVFKNVDNLDLTLLKASMIFNAACIVGGRQSEIFNCAGEIQCGKEKMYIYLLNKTVNIAQEKSEEKISASEKLVESLSKEDKKVENELQDT